MSLSGYLPRAVLTHTRHGNIHGVFLETQFATLLIEHSVVEGKQRSTQKDCRNFEGSWYRSCCSTGAVENPMQLDSDHLQNPARYRLISSSKLFRRECTSCQRKRRIAIIISPQSGRICRFLRRPSSRLAKGTADCPSGSPKPGPRSFRDPFDPFTVLQPPHRECRMHLGIMIFGRSKRSLIFSPCATGASCNIVRHMLQRIVVWSHN